MKKKLYFLLLIIGLCFAYPTGGRAGVNVDIGIGIGFPPPVVFQAPPPVVVVPGVAPYVYYAPGVQADLFFYSGYWWRPYEGHWYRSHYYDRGWAYVEPRRVPRPFYHLPPDYRQRNYGYAIPHGELNHNWSRWEKERYWDHQGNNQGHYQQYNNHPNQNYQGHYQSRYQQYGNRPNQNRQGYYDQYNYHPNQNHQ